MADPTPSAESVWTYRGYQLRPGEFTTAMVHFFRAEVQRANVWRQRLDATFNWAVLTTAAAISFAFTAVPDSDAAILLNIALVTVFFWIESRRYRYYELWAYRIRLLETDFFAAMLVPPFRPAPEWAEALAESLLRPAFPISMIEALGRRLRRNYLAVYAVLGVAWLIKVGLQPTAASNWAEFFVRASVGGIPGEVIAATMGLIFLALLIFSVATLGMNRAAGEVLPQLHFPHPTSRERAQPRARRRAQILTLIVTEQAEAIKARILDEMRRGVTVLSASGGYTGKQRPVLLCALTVTEVPHLKSLVADADPQAFVIVSPAQEILGKGFDTLEDHR